MILFYIITKTVRFNYIRMQFSQASGTRKTTLEKRFPSLNFRHPLESKGCLKFRLKDFPRQLFTVFRYYYIVTISVTIIPLARRNLKCVLVHNCLRGIAPSYLLSEVRHAHLFHGYKTRSRDLLHRVFAKTS